MVNINLLELALSIVATAETLCLRGDLDYGCEAEDRCLFGIEVYGVFAEARIVGQVVVGGVGIVFMMRGSMLQRLA